MGGSLRHLDRDNFGDLALGVILLMMYYTMSRSETPVPKARSGQNAFDPNQHIESVEVEQPPTVEEVLRRTLPEEPKLVDGDTDKDSRSRTRV